MTNPLKVGLLCLKNSPLKTLMEIYLSEHPTFGNLDFYYIQANKKLSEANIERFRFRTQGVFERHAIVKPLAIPTLAIDSHTDAGSITQISKLGLDFGINLGTHTKLTSSLFSVFKNGVLNCHPGDLPKYRGSSSLEWALYNHDPVISTLHLMDESIDTGPILDKSALRTELPLTYFELRALILWNAVSQPIAWLSWLHEELSKSGTLKWKSCTQGDGQFWNPIPDEFLTQVIKARERNSGASTDFLEGYRFQDWRSKFSTAITTDF